MWDQLCRRSTWGEVHKLGFNAAAVARDGQLVWTYGDDPDTIAIFDAAAMDLTGSPLEILPFNADAVIGIEQNQSARSRPPISGQAYGVRRAEPVSLRRNCFMTR